MKEDSVVLTIERFVAGGYGLARGADGVVLVRGAFPGERVSVRPRLERGVLRAHALEILEPHPARVRMPLPPGADLPLAYDAQLPIKEALVREALERIGKIETPLLPIEPSPRELGYRAAAQYATTEGGLGARAVDSDRVVAIDADPLVIEPIASAMARVRSRSLHGIQEVTFRASLHEDRALVGLIGDHAKNAERLARALENDVAGVVWSVRDRRGRFRGKSHVLTGTDRMIENFGGVLATVTVQSFAQVNPPAAGALYREAARIAGNGSRAIDVYAGSGILALHLAPSFEDVVAIEIAADAVRRGQADARRAKAGGVRFERGDARTVGRHMPADLVALDPPRAGLSPEVVDALLEGRPARIVYVSCNPATWARDVARLVSTGYAVTFIRPYDFFPYTHHVEVLSVLESR